MNEFIPQMRPLFGELEKIELEQYLAQDVFYTEFNKTREFETLIADFVGSKHCVVVNNGTISLTLAALALGIGHGDEVIVPNYTMIATANAMQLIGAEPIFVDVDPTTLIISADNVEQKISAKTKAVIVMSANGREHPDGINSLIELCNKYNLHIIEDAAQSLGSFYSTGKHVGTEGLIGSFSFSAPKIISTGQGGALVTDDEDLAEVLRKLKDFGRSSGGQDVHPQIGYNFKFTDLQACVGIAQMKQLEQRLHRKKDIWKKYKKNLQGCSGIELFDHDISICTPWFIDARVEDRDGLMAHLIKNQIGTRKMYGPVNAQGAYNKPGSFPVSEEIGKVGLWLPSMIQLSDNQIDRICDAVMNYYH